MNPQTHGPSRIARRPHGTSLRVGELAATMAVAAAIGCLAALGALAVDRAWLTPPPIELAEGQSIRTLLSGVVGGLITIAVFSLWMRTVVVGLVADQFSPRTLVTFLGDRFQRHLLGSMATGVAAVLVLLVAPFEADEPAPLISTLLATLITLAALAGVLLAIQHATRSLSVPDLVSRLADEALEVLARQPREQVDIDETPPTAEAATVRAPGTGWVTAIDTGRIRTALPPHGAVHLQTRVGAFVTPRTPLAVVSLAEADDMADLERVSAAITLARTRSPQMDLAFAIGQLLDVGAHALQGSIDTATGHEAVVHLGAVLEAVIERGLPLRHDADADGRRVHDEAGWDAADHVKVCAERLREPSAREPEAARHLIRMLRRLHEVAVEVEQAAVASEIARQAEMLLEVVDANRVLPRDRQRLEREAGPILASDGDQRPSLELD